MEDVNIPSDNVPAELKACEQILKRAKELKKAEPVVAYWCKLQFLSLRIIRADK
jgi:vacuolar protein sorting-associated protein VTA1